MTKAEPLGLSEEDRVLVRRVFADDLPYTCLDGMILSEEMLARLLAAARSQPIGVVETHFERPEQTQSDLVKGRSDAQHYAEKIETVALAIYETWSDAPGYVPWMRGGNSTMQEKARDRARSLFPLPPTNGGGEP